MCASVSAGFCLYCCAQACNTLKICSTVRKLDTSICLSENMHKCSFLLFDKDLSCAVSLTCISLLCFIFVKYS